MRARTLNEYIKLILPPDEFGMLPPIHFDKKTDSKIKAGVITYFNYHNKVAELYRIRKRGHAIGESQQRRLIKSAVSSENDLKKSLKATLEMFRKNKPFMRFAQKRILRNLSEVIIFSNPCYFDLEIRKSIMDLNISMRDWVAYHIALFNLDNKRIIKKVFAAQPFEKNVDRLCKQIDRIDLVESIDDLKNKRIITIEGTAGGLKKLIRGVVRTIIGGVVCSITWPFLLAPGLIAEQTVFGYAAATAVSGIAMAVAGIQEVLEETGIPSIISTIGNVVDTYSGEYVGNKNSKELHRICCEWEKLMLPWNRISFESVNQALNQGYNGCWYCLREHSTD